MATKNAFLGELKHESSLTKKILERVPIDKKDWKPHEKSMTIGRLATHIAENFNWIAEILSDDIFDFAARQYKSHSAASLEELLTIFQTNLDRATAALEKATDEDFNKVWTAKRGDTVMFQMPKKVAIRSLAYSHMIHHRGQLTVYLRLLDIPVPGLYGPSADEK